MAPSIFPASPEDLPPAEMGSWLMRFGSAVGAGTLGATLATAPAILRLERAGVVCSPFGAWALLIAATVLPMSLLVVLLRRARGGFLALGKGKDRVPMTMLVAWIGSTFVVLAFFGAILRSRTHHHALAGVTFAITALFLSLVLALIWKRFAALTRRTPRLRAITVAVSIGLMMAIALAQHGWIRERAPALLTAEGAKLVDVLAFALGALVASGRRFVNRRALALVGPPLAAILLVLGASSLRACPSLRETLYGRAPAASWIVGLVCAN